jgi:hypothetical protein
MYRNARRSVADTKPCGYPKPDADGGADDRAAISGAESLRQ